MSEKARPSESREPDAAAEGREAKPPETSPQVLGETQAIEESAGPSESAGAKALDFLGPPQADGELGQLGGYRILRRLGAGGMGMVFLAEDPQLGRKIALKVMAPALAAEAAARQRFLREARACAALRHDHVVTVYQVAEDRGVPFLAMELLSGESLEARLDREGRLSATEAMRIGREIGAGLEAAHEQGLIHRDIKPANIWLEARRGQPSRVKILDFGLAHFEHGDERLTQTGAVVGTPHYMSPEQAGGEHSDQRTDLFSLGCVLYRMTAGRLPFAGSNIRSALKAVMFDAPPSLGTLAPDVPPGLTALIERLLAKDPNDRPQSAAEAGEALAALEAELAGGAPRSAPPGATTAEYRPADTRTQTRAAKDTLPAGSPARFRRPSFLAGALGLALLGGGLMFLGLFDRSRPSPIPTTVVRTAPLAANLPFVVLARAGAAEKPVASLAEAVAAAASGDTIEIHGDGPFVIPSIDLQNKAITIRAGAGFVPVIEQAMAALPPNTPLLRTRAPLILEGLTMRRDDRANPKAAELEYLIVSKQAPLRLANCRLEFGAKTNGVAVWANESPVVEVRNSFAVSLTWAGFVNWDPPIGGRMLLENNVAANVSMMQRAAATASLHRHIADLRGVSVRLARNTLGTLPCFFYQDVDPKAGIAGDQKPFRIDASENVFGRQGAVFSYNRNIAEGKPGAKILSAAEIEDQLRGLISWREERNVYPASMYCFQLIGQKKTLEPTRPRTTLADWNEFWGLKDTGSLQGGIRFKVGDLPAKLAAAPERITPEDFRLDEDSAGFGARPGGRDLGADIDLVGPGPAYERWKKMPDYQQWLSDPPRKP